MPTTGDVNAANSVAKARATATGSEYRVPLLARGKIAADKSTGAAGVVEVVTADDDDVDVVDVGALPCDESPLSSDVAKSAMPAPTPSATRTTSAISRFRLRAIFAHPQFFGHPEHALRDRPVERAGGP